MEFGYLIHILIVICIHLILALSLQLTMGYTGLLNLGHIGFFGIGAYASAILSKNGFPPLFGFFLSGIIGAVFGYLLGAISNRLKKDYLGLLTMGFTFIMFSIFNNWKDLTNGPTGISGIDKISVFGEEITNNFSFLIFALVIVVFCFLVIKRIVHSPFGLVMQGIRGNEEATKRLGKNTFQVKNQVLALSAFFAALAGGLEAHYVSFISPTSFTLMELVPILTIVIIAGLATLRETVIATVLLVLFPEVLRFIGFPQNMIGPLRQIVYISYLILILAYKPRGLAGKLEL